jgi:hypothetical protein
MAGPASLVPEELSSIGQCRAGKRRQDQRYYYGFHDLPFIKKVVKAGETPACICFLESENIAYLVKVLRI